MTPRGRGLRRFPAGAIEQREREERRRMIRQARRERERVEVDGRRYWLVRLPDGAASDYAVSEPEEDVA